MFDCSSLYESNKSVRKRNYIKLLPKGNVVITLNDKKIGGNEIAYFCQQIYYIIHVYKQACKCISIYCENFVPVDKLSYILFESIIFNLTIQYRYQVNLNIKDVKTSIHTEGLVDSTINRFFNNTLNQQSYIRRFEFEQNMKHFRRVLSTEALQGAGVSKLQGELKVFFSTSEIVKKNTDQLANVISELVDNVGEHTTAECLVDVDISRRVYNKKGDDTGEYIAVNTVVVNFSSKCLADDIKEKVLKHLYEGSARYDLIEKAYSNHKVHFNKDYNEQDFFNIVSFQDQISGRKRETQTGGTGLTQLIKSLEANAASHSCYVLSGNQGVVFFPDLLEYNEDNWIGFNQQKDFINDIPDEGSVLRSTTYLQGTAYNFTLVYRREKGELYGETADSTAIR